MSDTTPRFDDLVDANDPDRDRLESIHQLLAAAGPPPELPPALETAPPEPRPSVLAFPRRRHTAIAAVVLAACVLFGIGYAVGGRTGPETSVRTIAMSGPAGATASIALQPVDAAGNWPMVLAVQGLPRLPAGKSYSLWLTRNGKLSDPCGSFATGPGTTSVPLNAPYRLKEYDGWVVVRTGSTRPFVLRTANV
jgi:hypothetical protein